MVSAIITTYKREPEMVENAINSVLAQTYSDFELIIVDDSPSGFERRNDVKNMIENIADSRIKYIQHETNKGACAARNTGIQNAEGEYIAFLDDDDEWLPQKLEKQLEVIGGEKTGLVYCDYNIINLNNGKETVKHIKTVEAKNAFQQLLIDNFIGSTSFPLIKKECFINCGMFDIQLNSSQDLEMWLRIVEKYEIVHIGEALVNYYIHKGEQITSSPSKKIQATELLNSRYADYLEKNPKVHGVQMLKLALFYATAGNAKKAIFLWMKAVFICPYSVYYNLRYMAAIVKHYKRKH